MDEGDMYESEVITFVAPKKSGWLKKRSKGETATRLSCFTQVSYLCVKKSGVELSLQYQNRENVGDSVLHEWHMYLLSSGSQCTARMRDGFVVHAVYAHSSKPVPFSCCTPVRAQFGIQDNHAYVRTTAPLPSSARFRPCGLGYVGKWKKHWFVLNDAVLYYFIAPQHQDEAPRCIIPLERINVDSIGTTDLTIYLQARLLNLHCNRRSPAILRPLYARVWKVC